MLFICAVSEVPLDSHTCIGIIQMKTIIIFLHANLTFSTPSSITRHNISNPITISRSLGSRDRSKYGHLQACQIKTSRVSISMTNALVWKQFDVWPDKIHIRIHVDMAASIPYITISRGSMGAIAPPPTHLLYIYVNPISLPKPLRAWVFTNSSSTQIILAQPPTPHLYNYFWIRPWITPYSVYKQWLSTIYAYAPLYVFIHQWTMILTPLDFQTYKHDYLTTLQIRIYRGDSSDRFLCYGLASL